MISDEVILFVEIFIFHSLTFVCIDWLIIYSFTSSSFHLPGDITIASHGWRAANFRPILGAQGLWAGRDLHLLRHGASVFPVSLVASYDKQGDVENLFLPGSSQVCVWMYVKGSLIDWLSRVLRPAQELFTYMETSPLPVKGCKIYAYARRSGPLSRERSFSCHTCCDTGPRFFRCHPKDRPVSRLLRHTWGYGGSILTQILTGE
jgi:hypothetical protein